MGYFLREPLLLAPSTLGPRPHEESCSPRDSAEEDVLGFLRSCRGRSQSRRASSQRHLNKDVAAVRWSLLHGQSFARKRRRRSAHVSKLTAFTPWLHARNFDTWTPCAKCTRALLVELPVNLLPLTPLRQAPAQQAGEWMSVEETLM